MTFRFWIGKLLGTTFRSSARNDRRDRHGGRARRRSPRPRFEILEDRMVPAAVLTVMNNSDTGGVGDGSLRGEIAASAAGDTIVFAPSLAGHTIMLTAANGQLLINHDLTIAGLGADLLTVRGSGTARVFNITGGTSTISGLKITGGGGAVDGAAIRLDGANGNLIGLDIEGNAATGPGGGGGIHLQYGTVNLRDSTVANNTATGTGAVYGGGYGAGIETFAATLTLTNSTVANNTDINGSGIGAAGIAIFSNGLGTPSSLTLESSTLSGNVIGSAGEAADFAAYSTNSVPATVSLHNTILNGAAGNPAGTPNATIFNAGASVTSQGHNLSSDVSLAAIPGPGDINGANPLLGSLGNHGGATPTMNLLFNSPAINNGAATGAPVTDQRGARRGATSGFGSLPAAAAGGFPDIGAFEDSSLYVVTSSDDAQTAQLGRPYDTSLTGTLRGGVEWANASFNPLPATPQPNTILFDITPIFAPAQTITLQLGQLTLSNTTVPETIGATTGLGSTSAATLTVSGNNASRVFRVNSSVTGAINALTISNGSAGAAAGGGVYNSGTLAINNAVIANNKATNDAGILNLGGSLTITNSTITGNTATGFAGGIGSNGGSVTISASTLSNNAAGAAGALGVFFGGNQTALINSTISGNTGGSASVAAYSGSTLTLDNSTVARNPDGGVKNGGGTINLFDTLIAGNTGFDVSGAVTSQGHNLIENPAGGSGFAASDILNPPGGAKIGMLGDNGGPTQTIPLLPGSPAIDRGDNTGVPATDQRGLPRIVNGTVDIGAFEVQTPPPPPPADLAVAKTGPATVTAGQNASYTITITNNGPADAQNVNLSTMEPAGTTFVSLTQLIGPTSGTLPAGGTETFRLVVHVNANVASGASLTDTASVSSSTTDSNLANNTASFTSTVAASADLAITNTGPASASAGQAITYTLSVRNNGPSDAQNVSVSDMLPSGETFLSASVGSGSGTSYASGNLGTLAAGSSTSITLVARINGNVAGGSTLTDTATVSSSTSDPNAINNTATFNTTVSSSADLAITKTGGASGTQGGTVTYTLSVTNHGPNAAQNVSVTDMLPSGETFVSASVGSGSGTSYAANLGTVAASGSVTIILVARISASVPNGSTLTDTATVSSSTSDPNLANNTAQTSTTVAGQADLSVSQTGPTTVTRGTDVTYMIKVLNNGPASALSVTLDDLVPSGMTFVSATQIRGPMFMLSTPSAGGTGNIHGSASAMAFGDVAQFMFVFHVNSNAPVGSTTTNTAHVGTSSMDPNLANNTSMLASTIR
jgi:uncharacterized repeat protein (TIGR01451 family)